MDYTKDSSTEQFKQLQEDTKQRIIHLLNSPLLDEYGYPTSEALEIIELWPYDDETGWFTFIKPLWHLSDWGWRENEGVHEIFTDKKLYRYYLSTAGWSGNEEIIRAMIANKMLWSFTWVSSRRGGHYQFEVELEKV
jgi:hypothetical protein